MNRRFLRKRWYILIAVAILPVISHFAVAFQTVHISADKGIVSIELLDHSKLPPPDNDLISVSFTPVTKVGISSAKELIEYDGYKLEYGLWYDEYTRIYSIGGKFMVVEISNYPRVYRDMVSHVYLRDETFTVAEADLNYYDENGRWYQDSQGKLFAENDKATHFAGEGLPGSFPAWLEYTTLQNVKTGFNIDKLVSDCYFKSAVLLKEDGTMTSYTNKEVISMITGLNSKSASLTVEKGVGRQLLYIFLTRVLYDNN